MESKKLPVVWLRSDKSGLKFMDDGRTRHDYFVIDREAAFNEPYIPAARVREALRRIDELLVIQTSCRETTKPEFIREFDAMVSCTKDTRRELAALIADVEDDGN